VTFPEALTVVRRLRQSGLNPPVSDEVWAESVLRWNGGR
jgi:hypothetical protein